MSKKKLLRIIGFMMFIVALIFVFCALSNPTLGCTIYIGNYAFGAEQWRVCYAIYVILMVGVFVASFFTKEKGK